MISYVIANDGVYWEMRGLSTDVKPIEGVPNGSTFTEMDTRKVFFFNAETKTWI